MGRCNLASVALNVRSAAGTCGQWQSAIRPGLRYQRAPAGRGTRVDADRIGGATFYSLGVTKNRGLTELIVLYSLFLFGAKVAVCWRCGGVLPFFSFHGLLLLPNIGV
jgi:hypothetical protein